MKVTDKVVIKGARLVGSIFRITGVVASVHWEDDSWSTVRVADLAYPDAPVVPPPPAGPPASA